MASLMLVCHLFHYAPMKMTAALVLLVIFRGVVYIFGIQVDLNRVSLTALVA